MRKMIVIMASMMYLSLTVNAQDSGIGVGLSSGGLSGKYWLNSSTALSVHLNSSDISVDYLLNRPDMLSFTNAPTPVYYGAGSILGSHEEWNTENLEFDTELDMGIKGVIGMSYYLSAYPIDFYLEESPAFYVLGGKGLDLLNLTFGFRYFF